VTAPATRSRAAIGRSANTRGKAWMADFAAWVREWFPGFEVISGNGRGDGAGMLDWTVELKSSPDDYKMTAALDQVIRDQAARGTRWHVVARKRFRTPVRRGMAIMTLEQWVQIARVLDDPGVQLLIDPILKDWR
jgi:hypothetical protein